MVFCSQNFQVIKFYRSAAIDFDIDTALETLIFVSAHFIINTQFYCSLFNASLLRRMSASLIEEMAKGINNFLNLLYCNPQLPNFSKCFN